MSPADASRAAIRLGALLRAIQEFTVDLLDQQALGDANALASVAVEIAAALSAHVDGTLVQAPTEP